MVEGLRVFDLPSALIYCGVRFFESNPTDVRVALSVFVDASEVLAILLDGGHSSIAGRLAGAFRNNGQGDIANDILTAMRSAGNDVRESDPFNETNSLKFSLNSNSAYSNRIRAMWEEMRDTVIKNFPPPPKSKLQGSDEYLRQMDDLYVTDAYHSLSIEGYSVTPELIQEVSATDWVPTGNPEEYDTHNAWAAHGYWKAYQAVCTTIKQILAGKNAGEIVQKDHRLWYSELFSPGVIAGIIQPSDLAGYRNTRVYIRHSRHVPPNKANLLDGLTTFFELLKQEDNAAVRVVLGYFIFVHIHPYMDGNGRLGRFLMNAMLASGGYPWLVVPLNERKAYMQALEQASVNYDIKPFTQFLATLSK